MLDQHVAAGADVTLATILIDPTESSRFGVLEIDRGGKITGFE
jgi:glucose-1-phosphate adenylyltransferase